MSVTKTLESGKELVITPAPFADAKEVYQAFVEQLAPVNVDEEKELDANLFKDLFVNVLTSKRFEDAVWACMRRCKYGGHKITESTFEDVSAREDYLEICYYVAWENIHPFLKTLMQKYSHILGELNKALP